MKNARVDKIDQLLMQLAHYFITVENYTPIIVKGVQNEIWLENIDAPYKIVRINANHVHNNEQLDFDLFKVANIVKQVRKRTLSFSLNTLNIILDAGNTVEHKGTKNIDCVFLDEDENLARNEELNGMFPALRDNLVDSKDGIEFVINITNDINQKTARDNDEYEEVFRKKDGSVTKLLIAMNVILFVVANIGLATQKFDLYTLLSLNGAHVQNGEIYRLITAGFMHANIFYTDGILITNIFHLIMNMYALHIIGEQIESFVGKGKYVAIYFFSMITGNLLSCLVNGAQGWALGASGAIFGLMGALLYFGYHYRLYLDNVLKTQIIPLILLNFTAGFLMSGIDNAGHIGGFVGGLFMTMALGIKNRSSKQDRINGVICSTILIAFLSYILFLG